MKKNERLYMEAILKHVKKVGDRINLVIQVLQKKAMKHDESKFLEPEFSNYSKRFINLHNITYGSKEYKKSLKGLDSTIKHHYNNNDHHPEYYTNGIKDMNLMDLIEMLMDWWAATEKHDDGNIFHSLEISKKRFGYSDDLDQILKNTINFLKNFKEKKIK